MAQEVELKLTLPEAEQGRFLRSPLLRHAAERGTERLVNIYYDTPDFALHCNGMALRLRRSGKRWVQTVKCAGTAHAGLSSRPEWEIPYGGGFDFSVIDDPATKKRLDRLKTRLGAAFETNFRRTAWTLRQDRTELLVTLDRGGIAAAGKIIPISEVEIELVQGDVAHIFDLADQLAQQFPLVPSLWSKAERGYRLLRGIPDHPVRAAPVDLHSGMTPTAAFRCIALSCLDHLQQNYHGAVHADDVEYIHQMRVALRRLRAALRLFRAVLPPSFEEQLLPSMRRPMAALGAARDLDVLVAEIVAPVISALPDESRLSALAARVAQRRHSARQQAISLLRDREYGRLLLLLMRRLNELPDSESEAGGTALAAFVTMRLKRQRRDVVRRAESARKDAPIRLHATRIAAKRMRYALEFLAPLLAPRRTARLIGHMTQLQDKLGQLNDLANAGALLMDCAGDDAGLREAVSLIGGWHGPRYASLLVELPQLTAKLRKLRLPKVR